MVICEGRVKCRYFASAIVVHEQLDFFPFCYSLLLHQFVANNTVQYFYLSFVSLEIACMCEIPLSSAVIISMTSCDAIVVLVVPKPVFDFRKGSNLKSTVVDIQFAHLIKVT
jgi:hypothetical protein